MAQDKYFHQAHFWSLSCQSNLFGMSKVKSQFNESFNVIVSSGKTGQITCIGFQRSESGCLKLKPISKELEAGDLSIPDGAELVCLDAFNQEEHGALVLGFCFTKEDGIDNNTVQWLNISNIIWTQLEPRADFSVAGLMQGLSSVEIDFGCIFLKHVLVKHNGMLVNLCLVSGDDSKVHVFMLEREDFGSTNKYSEVLCDNFFPELHNLSTCVTCLDILEFGDKRITAIGCDNGATVVCVVDLTTLNILQRWETKHDHPILVVKLYFDTIYKNSVVFKVCHLFASSVTTPSVVYRDVLKNGFKNVKTLPDSNCYDLVMCACVVDIDWDGERELLLGTNGHSLLAYKWCSDEKTKGNLNTGARDDEEKHDIWLPVEEYRLVYERKFAHSLMALEYADITGDGICELVILCTDGVRILQHNLEEGKTVLMERLGSIK
ncbi:KICSTOR complex protein kaptin-like [Anneissia japonica]|uniref:KICSTOR complex protein kaptin-like n=1 Tax=Anneissia japonica TaxID=1529436 RepID=UPI001425AD25|nr:KICSTOR complex protein kaptin-like [Anneissia japonica]